jgi:CheY-like chemotaxis protein
MRVKEDLIGPAREQAPRPVMVDDVLLDAVHSLDLPSGLIKADLPAHLPLVVADPVQLNRVFVNLLRNAQEALEGQSNPEIKLRARPDATGDFIQINVTDNGLGIPAGEIDKIWGTFHTTKGVKGHAGLGLPACRLILEHIGGHISVISLPGQGTTFIVSLPVYKEKEAKTKLEPGKGKILLIDDNDRWRQFAEAILKTVGYKVSVAEGHDATYNYNQYDLILVDDVLAYSDSLTVLQAIAAAGPIAKTVVVSSNPRVERTKVRMLLGIQNLLSKPYTQVGLLSEIKKALSAVK